jgi:hypothetical protein
MPSSRFFFCTSLSGLFWLCLLSFAVKHTTQTSMLPAEIEHATPASDWPQDYGLYRAATGIGIGTP